jgi:SAM-dependent methyltransferase
MTVTSDAGRPCPMCDGHRYTPFFDLPGVPTQDGMLWKTRDEALSAPTGDIQLAFCAECGYIGNQLFDPSRIRYDHDYSFSLFFSPTFRTFLTEVASRLIERYGLRGRHLLEIACGEGDFLKLLCRLGANTGLGVDPSTAPRIEEVGQGVAEFVRDWYTEAYAGRDVDFICCRQALDQLPRPREMVELVRRNIGDRPGTHVYFEVPNAQSIFEDLLIRNIMYEKSSWFTAQSLAQLFGRCGFMVLSVEPCFDGGQYLGLEAGTAAGGPAPLDALPGPSPGFASAVASFSSRHAGKVGAWRERVAQIVASGQRAIAWGSGAGGVSFFSSLGIRDEVPFVVDINPKRQGRFMPLTGQEVVRPDFVPGYAPDVVIVTNASFEREIARQLADLGVGCEIWTI